jgi:hypothetical protein
LTDAANCGACGHACASGAWCSQGACWSDSIRAVALSRASTVRDDVDEVSTTALSGSAKVYAFADADQSVKIQRITVDVTSTITSNLSPTATFQVSKDLFTDLPPSKTTYDFHVAESVTNPFGHAPPSDKPVLGHVYAYGLVDVSNPQKPVHQSTMSTSGNGITITLPCDTSRCSACSCACACYSFQAGATAATDAWTRAGIDTVSQTATTVTCSTYAPEGIVAAFAD